MEVSQCLKTEEGDFAEVEATGLPCDAIVIYRSDSYKRSLFSATRKDDATGLSIGVFLRISAEQHRY